MNFIVKGTFKAGQKYEPFTKKITTLNKNLHQKKYFPFLEVNTG